MILKTGAITVIKVMVGTGAELKSLAVYDQLGRRVIADFQLTGTQQQVDLSHLSKGLYIFEVAIADKVLHEKVLIR